MFLAMLPKKKANWQSLALKKKKEKLHPITQFLLM
jgi:hypothetical protein